MKTKQTTLCELRQQSATKKHFLCKNLTSSKKATTV